MTADGPVRIAGPAELAVQVDANGSVRRIDHRDVIVNAYLGDEVEGGPANLFLRGAETRSPGRPSSVRGARGGWRSIEIG